MSSTLPTTNPAGDVKITHVIFDLDGLILDTERRYDAAYEAVCQRFGKHFTFELKQKTTGVPFLETAQIIVDDLQLPITAVECDRLFEECKPPRESILMPGADRLIRHLHSIAVPMAIATGSSKASFQWKSAPHQEFFSLFHHVLNVPDDPEVTRGKPDPLPYIVAAARFSPNFPVKDNQNVLVFEDAIAGIKSANAAGMCSIWVPDPRMPEEITKEVGPFKRLRSLEDFRPEEFGLLPFPN